MARPSSPFLRSTPPNPRPGREARVVRRTSIQHWIAATLCAVAAFADPILVTRSVTGPGTADAQTGAMSWDDRGRYALLHSMASDLVPGQNTPPSSNARLFLWDSVTGEMRLVAHDVGLPTTSSNFGGDAPGQISGDGDWVLLASHGEDLVAGQVDTPNTRDVFLWHRPTDTMTLVSHAVGNPAQAANGPSALTGSVFADGVRLPRMSSDGRFVVYQSLATDLVAQPQADAFEDVYLFDRTTGLNRLVSHAPSLPTTPLQGASKEATISADGRWVAFESTTSGFGPIIDLNGGADVFLWDRDAPASSPTVLLSRIDAAGSQTGDAPSTAALVTDDGSAVIFTSVASNLLGVTSDTNGASDVFRFERATGGLSLVSHRAVFVHQTANAAAGPRVAANVDGSIIAFASQASNHVSGQIDSNAALDVFLWTNPTLQLVSHVPGSPTTAGNGTSTLPWLDPVGIRVVFESTSTDLAAGQVDTQPTARFDAFSWDRASDTTTLLSHLPGDSLTTGNDTSFLTGIARRGRAAAVVSLATDFAGPDTNLSPDAFLVRVGLIFADGFESGGTGDWSATSP